MDRKNRKSRTEFPADLTSPEAVERFREAAAEFTREATRSRKSAMDTLVNLGIYTKAGKLTKNYRS